MAENKYYHCKLCNFSSRTKINLIQHIHSLRHLRNENFRQMQQKSEGRSVEDDIRETFLVKEYKGNEKIIFDSEFDARFGTDLDIPSIEDTTETPPTTNETLPLGSAPMLKQALLDHSKQANSTNEASTDQTHSCPFCNYTSANEVRIQMHVVAQHSQRPSTVLCPLCQEKFKEWIKLENHLTEVHHVNNEGVQRLLALVDKSDWIMPPSHAKQGNDGNVQTEEIVDCKQDLVDGDCKNEGELTDKMFIDENPIDEFSCHMCGKTFVSVEELFNHQNELSHLELKTTSNGPRYFCWRKGCNQYFKSIATLQIHFKEVHTRRTPLAVSERHVYKYRCNQCSLAFKTLEKLQLHSQYHIIRAATKCVLCGKNFRSIPALQKHVELAHADMTKEEAEQYRASLANNPLLTGGVSGILTPETSDLLKKEIREDSEQQDEMVTDHVENQEKEHPPIETDNEVQEVVDQSVQDGNGGKEQQIFEDYINSQAIAEDSYNDPGRKYKCHRCKVAFTRQSYLTSHNKTLLHRKGEKLSYPMEKYLDPNRPYKCEICKESFTQKNILLVHYNSVSHLHKLKQSMKESNQAANNSSQNNSVTPSNSVTTVTTSSGINNLPSANTSTSTNDSDKKPYKCNICKVAYSQGSTLDIHIRSVLHQTRASKLHELAITGQIDLSIPLVERPDPTQHNQEQKPGDATFPTKVSPPTSQCASAVSPHNSSNLIDSLTSNNALSSRTGTLNNISPQLPLQLSPDSSLQQALNLAPHIGQPPVLIPSQVSPQTVLTCQRCNAVFMSQEALIQHQQLYCFFQQPSASVLNNSATPNPVQSSTIQSHATQQSPQQHRLQLTPDKDDQGKGNQLLQLTSAEPSTSPSQPPPQQTSPGLSQQMLRAKFAFPRTKPLMYRHLLESFGFDVVMQFNELTQKKPKKELDKRDADEDIAEGVPANQNCREETCNNSINNSNNNNNEEEDKIGKTHLPEINKSLCPLCQKEFSSIWVLKTHQEEIHKVIVPVEIVEKFALEFRSDYEKRTANQSENHPEDLPAPSEASCSSPSVSAESSHGPTPTPVATSLPPVFMPTSGTPPVTSFSSIDMASSVTTSQMAAQIQFNQLLMSMGLGMGLPMGMNMPFAAAMNLHPPLIPVMMPPPLDPLVASAFSHPIMPGAMDPNFFSAQQKLLQQQQQLAQTQQKRARTRISDEQLKILRAYFDINNSPTEEQLMEMSDKSGLPLKVIKHWFRNTLFKERQRNKDSPYNFNNPPSTFLNLEEYEKTGEAKVVDLKSLNENDPNNLKFNENKNESKASADQENNASPEELSVKQEANKQMFSDTKCMLPTSNPSQGFPSTSSMSVTSVQAAACSLTSTFTFPSHSLDITGKNMLSTDITTSPQTSTLTTPTTPTPCTPPISESPHSTGTPNSSGTTTPTTTSSSTTGKRANRTRFTDYQIKVLQEFFESNAYPKDDDLEYLSKLLNLSPRVIVVWFQNARQKARKVYENQPPVNPDDDGLGRFQRTPGLNYQCKKCLQVFQRYYELIKHQKSACFKDENPLAAQIKVSSGNNEDRSQSSPVASTSPALNRPPLEKFGQNGTYRCEKCSLVFPRIDLWREHQIVHIMNPNLFPNFNPNSPYGGVLPYDTQPTMPPLKRKLSEEEEVKESAEQPRDKRLRTTILPEQLDYLYQKYQMESNPSRKMLESIAREVGLKKRVVQVWFQNTRARERKGQFRVHQQVIHKRCPFCRALFKARSALESHLATRHADQYTKGDVNIDSLPDGDCDSNPEMPSTSITSEEKNNILNFPVSIASPVTSSFSSVCAESVQNSMKKYYEDSLKKYLDELCPPTHVSKESSFPTDLSIKVKSSGNQEKQEEKSELREIPLDLSKPLKVGALDLERSGDIPINLSERIVEDGISQAPSIDEAPSETYSESTDNMEGEDASHESNPTSPASNLHNQRYPSGSGKRFRTQMTTVQLKVMKSIFSEYKTPSMAECEMLGREIGLPKRVVQVWFQNARAKEKKSKLVFAKTFGQELEVGKPPEECVMCGVKYNQKYSNTNLQDHLFSKKHLDNLKLHITNMKLKEGQEGIDRQELVVSLAATSLPQSMQQQSQDMDHSGSPPTPSTAGQANLMQQLQMMGLQQMAAGLPIPMNLNQTTGSLTMNMPAQPSSSAQTGSKLEQDKNRNNSKNEKSPTNGTSTNNVKNPISNDIACKTKEEDKELGSITPAANQTNNNMLNPMGDFVLSSNESSAASATNLFPYMYTGFPGYYAGVPGAFIHPTMYTGRNQL